MKTKLSPAAIGAFVIGACALAVIALLSFGGISFFHKPQRFVVDFDESIHGLDLGSPVKLRGVRVGRVVDLSVRYDQASRRSVVSVFCEFNRSVISDAKGEPVDVSSAAAIQRLVDDGLRAQLGILGLATGLLYVELDFAELPEATAAPAEPPPGDALSNRARRYVAVPALRSTLAELQVNLNEILANLKNVDLVGLSQDLRALVVSGRLQIEGLASEWRSVGANLNRLTGGPEAEQLLVSLDKTLGDLRRVLTRLEAQLESSGEGLDATLAQARSALEGFAAASRAAETLMAAPNGLGEEATLALRRLSEAASAVERLAAMLEENPRALIFGKKKKRAAQPAKP